MDLKFPCKSRWKPAKSLKAGQPVDCSDHDPAKVAMIRSSPADPVAEGKRFSGNGLSDRRACFQANPYGISHFPMAPYPAVGGALIRILSSVPLPTFGSVIVATLPITIKLTIIVNCLPRIVGGIFTSRGFNSKRDSNRVARGKSQTPEIGENGWRICVVCLQCYDAVAEFELADEVSVFVVDPRIGDALQIPENRGSGADLFYSSPGFVAFDLSGQASSRDLRR